MDCYFIGFDKKVRFIKIVRHNTKPLTLGYITFLSESLNYNYPDSILHESLANRMPPAFTGGTEELKKHIESIIKYPIVAIENGIQGEVTVSFFVNTDKSITDVKVLKPVDSFLDRESVRIIKQTNGLWEAGTVDGINVSVRVGLTIRYRLVY